MIKVGIIGGAGYTAGELIRLLLNHPDVEIGFINSSSNAGNRLTDVHSGLYGETEIAFTDQLPIDKVDVVFLCLGHGKSAEFLATHSIPSHVKIIDLAQDFRIATPENDFVYGLPELQREAIKDAIHIANPGCFATCIQIALLPLAKAGILSGDIAVNAITGSTGAGVKPSVSTHFSYRVDNLSIYKAFCHQHVPEIVQSIRMLQQTFDGSVSFIPYRGNFSRGIFSTAVVYVSKQHDADYYSDLYKEFYKDACFTHYVDKSIDMKQVVNTNKGLVHVDLFGEKLLITSTLDNLLKGASGQAVQNMNLMFGIDEQLGLKLKASAF